jgi:cytochrome c oxidase subunit 2
LRKPRLFLLALLVTTIGTVFTVVYRARTHIVIPGNKLSTTPTTDASPDPLVVHAIGSEFRWTFRLPGDDGHLNTADDILSRDELHVPVGKQVELHLTSTDYIYMFNVPSLHVREAAVPELIFNVSFQPTTSGTHDIITDPMCGVRYFHDDVMGRVFVDSAIDFANWMQSQR